MTVFPRSRLFVLLGILCTSLLVACQTGGPQVETVIEEGPDGVLMVQTVRMQATVVAIDATNRTVRLQPKHGEPRTIKVGEGAVNFQNVRVGDEVHVTFVEETAVSLVRGGAPPECRCRASSAAGAGGR